MVKSNFVTLYLAFKSSIPTIINFLVGIEYNTQMIFFNDFIMRLVFIYLFFRPWATRFFFHLVPNKYKA